MNFSDYELYQILEENGYNPSNENLDILKENIDNGTMMLVEARSLTKKIERGEIPVSVLSDENRNRYYAYIEGKKASKQKAIRDANIEKDPYKAKQARDASAAHLYNGRSYKTMALPGERYEDTGSHDKNKGRKTGKTANSILLTKQEEIKRDDHRRINDRFNSINTNDDLSDLYRAAKTNSEETSLKRAKDDLVNSYNSYKPQLYIDQD